MKNNLSKNFIKSNDTNNFHREFASLTQVHFVFFNQKLFFINLFINFELI